MAMVKRSQAVGVANAKKLKEELDLYGATDWREKVDTVRMCRVSKMYAKEHLNLRFPPDHLELQKAMVSSLEQLGWGRKFGRAAPSFMERELQGWLEVLTKEM